MSTGVELTLEEARGMRGYDKLIEIDLAATIPFGEFMKLTPKERKNELRPIVADSAKWAATTKDLTEQNAMSYAKIVSYNGTQMATQTRRKKFSLLELDSDGSWVTIHHETDLYPAGKVVIHKLVQAEEQSQSVAMVPELLNELPSSDDELELVTKNYNNQTEEIKMADEQNKALDAIPTGMGSLDLDSMGDLGDLGDGSLNLGDLGEGAGTTKLDAFDANAPAATPDAKVDNSLDNAIVESLAAMEIADPFAVHAYNQNSATVLGYVTLTDKRNEIVTRSIVLKDDKGEPVQRIGLDDQRVNALKGGVKAKDSDFEHEFVIEPKQTKPGRVLAMIIEMYAGGIIPIDDFMKPGELQPDMANKDKVKLVLSSTEFPNFLDFMFDGKVKEDPRTHGGERAAGFVQQKGRNSKQEANLGKKNKVRRTMKTVGSRRSLLIDTNYFPLKTYETIPLNKQHTPEEIAKLNLVFGPLVRTQKSGDVKKFDKLTAEARSNFLNITEESFETKFFSGKVDERPTLQFKPFYNKDAEPIANPALAVRQEKVTEKSRSYPFIQYNSASEKDLKDPEKKAKTSLYGGQFDEFLEVVGRENLTESVLQDLTRRSGGTTSTAPNATVSNMTMLKLTLGLTHNTVNGEDVELDSASKESLIALQRKITVVKQGVELSKAN